MSAAAAQRTIEMIEREIVLAKESYVAAVAAENLTRANTYNVSYDTYDAVAYDLTVAAYIAANDALKLTGKRLRTLNAELATLRAR